VKIRFANTARISLHTAINFIHQDNPTAATNFLERVQKTLRRLEKYPESGRRIPEFPELPYRELLVLPYRLFYRVDGKVIFIVAVWHTAQIPTEPKK
jgi:toxin ParE1/3/4